MSAGPSPRPAVMRNAPYAAHAPVPGANRVVNLSFNEGAFGVPPAARRAMAEAAAELGRYPDGGATALRHAIGAYWKLDPERIVCGAGSDELLFLLCLAYGGEGTELIMSAHGFTMYEISGTNTGTGVVKVPERNLCADVDGMLAAVSPRTRLVMLANPNNPTGSLLPQREVERLRAGLPPEVLLVLDAAYAEYVDEPGYEAGARMVDAGNNVVMARTFSKIFGLGGARVGWAYAPPAVIDVLNRVRSPFNVSSASQAAAVGALAEPGWVEKGREHNTEWRGWLAARLGEAGVTVWPSQGNFLLADFGTAEGAGAADARLKARGIMVRRMGGYGLPHCLRITVGTGEECRMVAEALARTDA